MKRIRRAYLIVLIGCLAVLALSFVLPSPTTDGAVAMIVPPTAFLLIGLAALGYLAIGGVATVLTPAAGLALGLAIWFGVGGLAPAFGDTATRGYLRDSSFDFTPEQIFRTHQLAALGYAIVAAVAVLVLQGAVPTQTAGVGRDLTGRYLRRIIPGALVVGLLVNVFLEWPYRYGATEVPPPQSVAQLGILVTLSVVLIGFGLSRALLPRKTYLPLFVTVVAIQLVTSLLTFSKQAFLVEVIAAFAGFVLARPRKSILIGAVFSIVVGYAVTAPLLFVVRGLGDAAQASTISQRFDAVQTTAENAQAFLSVDPDPPNIAWARLSLNPNMAFVMRERAQGRPGNTILANALWSVVPRFLWPTKPVVTQLSRDLNVLILGSDASATSAGVLAEAYWNAGLWGLVLVCTFIGVLLGFFTKLSLKAVSTLDLPALFLIGQGVVWGLGFDGWFVMTYLGTIPLFLAAYFLLVVFAGVRASGADSPPATGIAATTLHPA